MHKQSQHSSRPIRALIKSAASTGIALGCALAIAPVYAQAVDDATEGLAGITGEQSITSEVVSGQKPTTSPSRADRERLPPFSFVDRDGDRLISRDEATSEPAILNAFERMDRDNDRNVSRSEYLRSMRRARRERRDSGRALGSMGREGGDDLAERLPGL